MFKKLLLILSLTAVSTQSDLNGISFKGMREDASKQLGKAKNFCWKTSPRKAATLISVSVAFYTLLAAFHNKVHEFDDFWGTFFKQGTHPRKMCELNGLRYDFVVKKRNQLEEAIKQLSVPRDEYIAAARDNGIWHTNLSTGEKISILTKYNEIVANPFHDQFEAIKELYSLARVSITSPIAEEVKTAAQKFKEACESVTITPFEDHLKSGKDYSIKKAEFIGLSKLPSCRCA